MRRLVGALADFDSSKSCCARGSFTYQALLPRAWRQAAGAKAATRRRTPRRRPTSRYLLVSQRYQRIDSRCALSLECAALSALWPISTRRNHVAREVHSHSRPLLAVAPSRGGQSGDKAPHSKESSCFTMFIRIAALPTDRLSLRALLGVRRLVGALADFDSSRSCCARGSFPYQALLPKSVAPGRGGQSGDKAPHSKESPYLPIFTHIAALPTDRLSLRALLGVRRLVGALADFDSSKSCCARGSFTYQALLPRAWRQAAGAKAATKRRTPRSRPTSQYLLISQRYQRIDFRCALSLECAALSALWPISTRRNHVAREVHSHIKPCCLERGAKPRGPKRRQGAALQGGARPPDIYSYRSATNGSTFVARSPWSAPPCRRFADFDSSKSCCARGSFTYQALLPRAWRQAAGAKAATRRRTPRSRPASRYSFIPQRYQRIDFRCALSLECAALSALWPISTRRNHVAREVHSHIRTCCQRAWRQAAGAKAATRRRTPRRRPASRCSFVSQRYQRIDFRCATRRYVARQNRYRD